MYTAQLYASKWIDGYGLVYHYFTWKATFRYLWVARLATVGVFMLSVIAVIGLPDVKILTRIEKENCYDR